MAFDSSKHPRGNSKNKGEFGSGGGGSSSSKGGAAPQESKADRVARAQAAHPKVTKAVQRYAEEHNEASTAKTLGGVSLPNGEPVDVIVPADPANLEHWRKTTDAHRSALDAYNKGGKKGTRPKRGDMLGSVGHAVELKTVLVSKKAEDKLQISMKGDAMARKAAYERKTKTKIHTVVIDDRKVFNAFGPGLHDESQRRIFYANGYGNLKLAAMHECKGGMAEVKQLMNTPYNKLPPAAQKRRR